MYIAKKILSVVGEVPSLIPFCLPNVLMIYVNTIHVTNFLLFFLDTLVVYIAMIIVFIFDYRIL